MLLFYQKIFENFVRGTQDVFTSDMFFEILGSADAISVSGNCFAVEGTSPTITCQIEQSFDGMRWRNRSAAPELSAAPITPHFDNALSAFISSPGSSVASLARLRITLGGTSPSALVQLFAVGRTL